jgi:two-component system OmpR family sensor kinase
LVTIISGLVAGAYSFYVAFREAQELQDDQLQQIALVVERSGKVEPWAGLTEAEKKHDPDARIVIAPLGEQIPAGQDLPQVARPWVPLDLKEGFQTINSQGENWRLFVRTLPSGARIAVGQPTAVRNDAARGSGLRTMVPVLLLVPFLGVLTAWIVRRKLAPVIGLSRVLDQRDDTNLTMLPEGDVPVEILPFVTSINDLMRRLDETLAQQRRFIADAAHELRSPLAALTLQTENLAQSGPTEEREERLRQLRLGLSRTSSLLDQLLSLARQQSCVAPATELHLDCLVRQVLEDLMPLAAAKGIDLGCERLDNVVMVASREPLLVLMRNAVDNAVRYTQIGGKVDVELHIENGQVVFQVADNGRGIPRGEEQRIFEPFYRVMGSQETGSGLGLAIVRSIVDRVGGTVTLNNRSDGTGAVFRYVCRESNRGGTKQG